MAAISLFPAIGRFRNHLWTLLELSMVAGRRRNHFELAMVRYPRLAVGNSVIQEALRFFPNFYTKRNNLA